MNSFMIAGHLGKDPDIRFTASGQKVTSFNVAVNQRKGKEDVTMWIRVTVWGERFDKLIAYLKKGSAVIVIGELNPPSTYTDKEGRQQFSLEMTAETIRFSPFGKPDRVGEENTGSYSANHKPQSQSQAQAAYQENAYAPAGRAAPNAYAQPANNNAPEEEPLPF